MVDNDEEANVKEGGEGEDQIELDSGFFQLPAEEIRDVIERKLLMQNEDRLHKLVSIARERDTLINLQKAELKTLELQHQKMISDQQLFDTVNRQRLQEQIDRHRLEFLELQHRINQLNNESSTLRSQLGLNSLSLSLDLSLLTSLSLSLDLSFDLTVDSFPVFVLTRLGIVITGGK